MLDGALELVITEIAVLRAQTGGGRRSSYRLIKHVVDPANFDPAAPRVPADFK